jgi:hypothetical protein
MQWIWPRLRPASSKNKLFALVSLKRTANKAKSVDSERSAITIAIRISRASSFSVRKSPSLEKHEELGSDDKITAWTERRSTITTTSREGHHVVPGRPEMKTWLDLLDLAEHRAALPATAV